MQFRETLSGTIRALQDRDSTVCTCRTVQLVHRVTGRWVRVWGMILHFRSWVSRRQQQQQQVTDSWWWPSPFACFVGKSNCLPRFAGPLTFVVASMEDELILTSYCNSTRVKARRLQFSHTSWLSSNFSQQMRDCSAILIKVSTTKILSVPWDARSDLVMHFLRAGRSHALGRYNDSNVSASNSVTAWVILLL